MFVLRNKGLTLLLPRLDPRFCRRKAPPFGSRGGAEPVARFES